MTWDELLAETQRRLGDRQAARWLCETASGLTGAELDAALRSAAGERAVARLDAMVARYEHGEPLQYVLGSWGFRRLDLAVDGRALIPRPETEQLVEVCLELVGDRLDQRFDDPVTIADLGTGSGAIGLALATELPIDGVTLWLTDVSAGALALASANLAGIGRAARNVRIAEPGSWFEVLPDGVRFDLIVSNPPYVPEADPRLEELVRRHEPPIALYGGRDGLDHVRTIVGGAARWLRPGGWLALEIGAGHGAAVAELMAAAGLGDIEVRRDLAGHDRIALARTGA